MHFRACVEHTSSYDVTSSQGLFRARDFRSGFLPVTWLLGTPHRTPANVTWAVPIYYFDRTSFHGMCCSIFLLSGLILLARRIFCVAKPFLWWFGWLLRSHPDQLLSTFDFQLIHVFQITLLYSSLFSFLAFKKPPVFYLLCYQVAYRTFHSLKLDSILSYFL